MNWIDILVLVITILILVGALILGIYNIKHRKTCSCPAAKKIKKDLQKAHKEIEKEKSI